MRKGAQVGQAYWPFEANANDDTVCPYLSTQCRMLWVQGLYFESLGQYDKAQDNYRTILIVGCDIGVKGSSISHRVTECDCERNGVQALYDLIHADKLTKAQLGDIAVLLRSLKARRNAIEPFLISRRDRYMARVIRSLEHETLGAMCNDDYLANIEYSALRKIHANRKTILTTLEKCRKEEISYLSRPIYKKKPGYLHKRLKAIYEVGMPKGIPRVFRYYWSHENIRTRVTCMDERLQLFETIVALERYHKKRGEYPERLVGMVPDYLDATPIDLFSGRPLRYSRRSGKYLLYSVGPDQTSQSGQKCYESHHGAFSRGDIYIIPRESVIAGK